MRLQVFWTKGLTRTTHIFNKRLKWHITDTLHILRFPRVLNLCSSLRTDVKYHKKTMALNYRRQRLSTIKSFWTDSAICGATQRWQSPSKAKQKEKRKKKTLKQRRLTNSKFHQRFQFCLPINESPLSSHMRPSRTHSGQLRQRQVQTQEQTAVATGRGEDEEEANAARTCLCWLVPKHTDMREGGRKRKSSCLWSGLVPLATLAV